MSNARKLRDIPSLKPLLQDKEWRDLIWDKAVSIAADETGLDVFPESCPWTPELILAVDFFPEG